MSYPDALGMAEVYSRNSSRPIKGAASPLSLTSNWNSRYVTPLYFTMGTSLSSSECVHEPGFVSNSSVPSVL